MSVITVDVKPDPNAESKEPPKVNFVIERKARPESDWLGDKPVPLLDPENKEDKLPKEFGLAPNERLVILGEDPEPRVTVHDQNTSMTESDAKAYYKEKELRAAVDRADAEEIEKERAEAIKPELEKRMAERKKEREEEDKKLKEKEKAKEKAGTKGPLPHTPAPTAPTPHTPPAAASGAKPGATAQPARSHGAPVDSDMVKNK